MFQSLNLDNHFIELTEQQKNKVVIIHNQIRSIAQPEASNMQEVEWDTYLETVAKSFVSKCVAEHNSKRHEHYHKLRSNSNTLKITSYDWVGENIALGSGICKRRSLTSGKIEEFDCGDIFEGIRRWFDTRLNYNYTQNNCSTGNKCNLYTQIIWAKTFKIGCAINSCPSSMNYTKRQSIENSEISNRTIFVCNYWPGGNIINQWPFEAGPYCSKCPNNHSKCVAGLCTLSDTSQNIPIMKNDNLKGILQTRSHQNSNNDIRKIADSQNLDLIINKQDGEYPSLIPKQHTVNNEWMDIEGPIFTLKPNTHTFSIAPKSNFSQNDEVNNEEMTDLMNEISKFDLDKQKDTCCIKADAICPFILNDNDNEVKKSIITSHSLNPSAEIIKRDIENPDLCSTPSKYSDIYIECKGNGGFIRKCDHGYYFDHVHLICRLYQDDSCFKQLISRESVSKQNRITINDNFKNKDNTNIEKSSLTSRLMNDMINLFTYNDGHIHQPRVSFSNEPNSFIKGVLRHAWFHVNQSSLQQFLTSPDFIRDPDEFLILEKFQSPPNVANFFAQRLMTFYVPNITGFFQFEISCSLECSLWLSEDTYENHAKLIISLSKDYATEFNQWNKYNEQKSTYIYLIKNRSYFMEVFGLDIESHDSLSVGVNGPDDFDEHPIKSGLYLYDNVTNNEEKLKSNTSVNLSNWLSDIGRRSGFI